MGHTKYRKRVYRLLALDEIKMAINTISEPIKDLRDSL